MDELSTDELRNAAFAASLRRAFGGPVEKDLPSSFAVLLNRLSESLAPAAPRERDAYRLGA
jgi:hypothetical protein